MVSKATHTATYNEQNLIGFINYDRLLALCYLRFKSTNDMFKKKVTKWIPLGKWTWDGKEYVVMARRNLKTGMLKFKSKRVNKHLLGYNYPVLPIDIIDTKKAWEELVSK